MSSLMPQERKQTEALRRKPRPHSTQVQLRNRIQDVHDGGVISFVHRLILRGYCVLRLDFFVPYRTHYVT